MAGVNKGKRMLLLGLLPSKTFDLTRGSEAFTPSSYKASFSAHEQCGSHFGGTNLADLLLRLSKRESLRLCEEVGQEDAVMLGVGDGIVRGGRGEEVCRDDFRPLVD